MEFTAEIHLGTRMVLLGLSSDRATAAVETLRNNMSILAFNAMAGMSMETAELMAQMDDMGRVSLVKLAEGLSKLTGIPLDKALDLWAQGIEGNTDVLEPYLGQVIDTEDAIRKQTLALEDQAARMTSMQKSLEELGLQWGRFRDATNSAILAISKKWS